MRTKKILASLLALMMLFSLMPGFALAEGEEEEIEPVLVEEEEAPALEAEEPEAIPEPEDEPEDEPVAYDLWVCGVQVTDANAGDVLGDGSVSFDASANALSFTAAPTATGTYNDAVIYANIGDLAISTPDKGLSIRTGSAFGVYVEDGTLTVTGKLSVTLTGDSGDTCIYAENGLNAIGSLDINCYDISGSYGIKTMGPVSITSDLIYLYAGHCGLYCGSGDVVVTGMAACGNATAGATDSLCPSSGIYAANGAVTLGGIGMFGGASYTVYANGPVHITDGVNFENTANLLGGNGIKSTQGIVIDGDATIEAINCLMADGENGILINGNATLKPSGRNAVIATNGPLTVKGNLDARGARQVAIDVKGDITVEGDVYISASNAGYSTNLGYGMQSTDGSIKIDGNLTAYATKNPVYAKGDITVGGNVLTSAAAGSTSTPGDYGIKAETGALTVGGTLTCKGKAAVSAFGGESITVEKDATITNANETGIGMYSDGTVTFVSGKWDVDAGAAAIQAKEGIVIPEPYSITLPIRGAVTQLDSLFTITEEDGATVAAHAIIEEMLYEEGFYLIGPEWSIEDINKDNKFKVNPDNANEYMLSTKLEVGDKIKVVQVSGNGITAWYPDGSGTEYTVDQAHSGTVDIYFKTSYDNAWSEFGGFFYIAHVHDWQVTWTWSEDYTSATATFVCAGDPTHTATLEATVTVDAESMPASCYEDGYIFYDAVVTFEGKNYYSYKDIYIPAHHEWGEPTWEWAEDYSTAKATFVCQTVASHKTTKNATITSETTGHETVYTATVTLDGKTYTDTKTVTVTTVTVTFNAGDGTVDPATVEVNVGGAIGELPTPTRDGGWVFLGWFTTPMESYLLAGQGTRVTTETTFDEDTTVYAHWRLPGDINGDGKVNNKDVTRLQKYLEGEEEVEVVEFNLDVNGDGKVNNKDLTRLQKYLKGDEVEIH